MSTSLISEARGAADGAGEEASASQLQESTAATPAVPAVPTADTTTLDPTATLPTSLARSEIEAIDSITGNKLLIQIQNISSTANLGVKLDLKKIALKCRNTEFNPRRFGAVTMRLREPRATALIFASGKICVSGVKSVHNASLAAKKFHTIIEEMGFKPKEFMDFKVQNIVGTADCGFPIRLEAFVYAHSAFASYEPELFPGLIYRLPKPRVVFMIFASGKLVITGAKKELDLAEALTKLYKILGEFKKSQTSTFPQSNTNSSAVGAYAEQHNMEEF